MAVAVERLVSGYPWEDTPLLEEIRRMRSIQALRLFVDLHGDCQFEREVGLEWNRGGISQVWDRTKLGSASQHTIYGFQPRAGLMIDPVGFPEKYGVTFGDALAALIRIGAVTMVPHLVDGSGDDVEVIHSLADYEQGAAAEGDINFAASDAARRLLGDDAIDRAVAEGFDRFVPLSAEWASARVVGIARLACPPVARRIVEWQDKRSGEWEWYAGSYERLQAAISRSGSK